jgi:hypothetical protein
MKKLILLIAVFAVVLHLPRSANGCRENVSHRNFWIVNTPGVEVIKAMTGDMIRMEVITASQNVHIAVTEGLLEVVLENPTVQQNAGKVAFVRAVAPGVATLKWVRNVQAQNEETIEQVIEIEEAPTMRCNP